MQKTYAGFMTAKGRLIEEMRKKGQTYKPKGSEASSTHESDYGGKRQPFKHPAPIGQKRSGEFCHSRNICMTYRQTTSAYIAAMKDITLLLRIHWDGSQHALWVCRRNWSIQASDQEERSCSRR